MRKEHVYGRNHVYAILSFTEDTRIKNHGLYKRKFIFMKSRKITKLYGSRTHSKTRAAACVVL